MEGANRVLPAALGTPQWDVRHTVYARATADAPVLSLVTAAVKATSRHHVRVVVMTFGDTQSEIDTADRGNRLEVRIIDQGRVGIMRYLCHVVCDGSSAVGVDEPSPPDFAKGTP